MRTSFEFVQDIGHGYTRNLRVRKDPNGEFVVSMQASDKGEIVTIVFDENQFERVIHAFIAVKDEED